MSRDRVVSSNGIRSAERSVCGRNGHLFGLKVESKADSNKKRGRESEP